MAENDFQRTPESPGKRRDGASEEKKGLWDIDLNASPPDDSGSDSPPAENSGGVREMRPIAAAVGLKFGENRGAIGAHLSRGETAGGEGAIAVTGYGKGKGKEEEVGEGNTRYWHALLEAASVALREYEESARGEEEKAGNRRRRPSREAEPREEAAARRTRRKVNDGRGSEEGAVVARSTRRRSVAMPSKYKDSVLHAAAVVVAEARCSRRRSG